MQFESTQSLDILMTPQLQYQQCEFCSRSFFKGKLKFHLKLCTANAPMTVSPKRSARVQKQHIETPQKSRHREDKICQHCHARLPSFLVQKHAEHCPPKPTAEPLPFQESCTMKPKSSTEANFKERNQERSPLLPAIKRTAKQGILREPYQVKVREELSCFRMAQQIKQIQCPNCQRIFSREASLRHFPICQALHDKQRLSIALRRRSNRSVGQQHANNKRMIKKRTSDDIQAKKDEPLPTSQINPEDSPAII